ncbi:ferrous iron transporter B [Treponema pectinovorum]|uniref:ferrous iron transporter B n=1 Tax=Treponema pectinovorum TaxID=164 RepID=UPI0011CBCB3A|nr:ferrous iron transporter B [Treponema pectinovorum]
MRIALAGNPNSGKTTLFNALTGSNQFVGNWPGVTVEKKEGTLKSKKDVTITDLPGIYSLSPYTLEEVVSRNYLIDECPDGILNIVDGTNLERNLYLTTQLIELGIPMVIAINMMDVVKKNGDKIDIKELSERLGCRIIEISALKGTGVKDAAEAIIEEATKGSKIPNHTFGGVIEHSLAHIEEAFLHEMPDDKQRWYAIKIFERDSKIIKKLNIPADKLAHIEKDIAAAEKELDDDSESLITNARYVYIAELLKGIYKKGNEGSLTTSDKIDRVVTNRFLALPIFALVMWLVYYVSMVTVGAAATDWANDGLFGDGFHLFGIGNQQYEEAAEDYGNTDDIINSFIELAATKGVDTEELAAKLDPESETYDVDSAVDGLKELDSTFEDSDTVKYVIVDEETLETSEEEATKKDFEGAIEKLAQYKGAPDPADYGIWVSGIPPLVESGLDFIGCADWLKGLILDGIIAGVGAVLGFVPQMFVLFIFLAFLEACGYMARIAFIMDRIFRRFGLSGKSFIPMLIGTGCGVPGVMASRTIENERDRRMTIMTTTFIPCGAKVPFIAMIAGAIFGGSAVIATSAYFIGVAAIIVSGIMLKKTKMFSGDPAPFVMELPAYHMPTVGNVLRSMWERGWSFIKKAGTIILLSTIFVWFTSFFGWVDGHFGMLAEDQMDASILARIGSAICWIFSPLGWGNWQATVASITGLVAKENIVGTMGILYGGAETYTNMALAFTRISGMSFLVFNLLCAPCFAAIGAIKREMNNARWTLIAVGYQCGFAYVVSLMINQIGNAFTNNLNIVGLVVAVAIFATMCWLLFRPAKNYASAK